MSNSHNTIPSCGQEAPTHPSRLQMMGLTVLAVLLYLVLMDAAVESFVSHSPLRWIISGTVTGYVALSVLLWRKLSWTTKASVSFFVLFSLLAFAAWRPAGSDSPLTLLRQPTSTLLSAATILGILLAGWILARFKFLPWPARVALVLLAAYGVAGFVLGIMARTPYTALLHGGSLWEKVPFWLQGAFLGAVVVLPAALLLQLLTGVSQIRAGQLADWGRQVLALGMCATITASGITSAAGPVASTTVIPEYTPLPPPPPNPFANEAAPAAYEPAAERFRRLQSVTQSLAGLIDPATLDVAAKAKQLGSNIDPVFAFVRDAVGFEPYSGLLRGARGALIAQSANALDKSLLLAELLSAQGYKARIVPGSLSDKDTEKLMQLWLTTQPPKASLPAERIEQIMSEAGETEILRQARSAQSQAAAALNWVSQRSVIDAASITEVAGTPAKWFADTTNKRLREQAASHFWVQVEQGSGWVDLDPSFPEARMGQRFAEPGGAFEPSAPPRSLLQTIAIKMTAEYAAERHRSQQVVLDAVLPTEDLVTQQMHLVNVPVGACCHDDLSDATRFQAVLQVGKKRFEGTQYTLGGPAGAGSQGGVRDLFGALGGGESVAQVLTGLWMDITLSGPGLKSQTERRYLLDRIGFSARAQGKDRPIVAIPAGQLPYLLTRSYDILVMPAPYSESLAGWLASQFLLENQEIFRLAIDVRYGKADPAALSSALAAGTRLIFPLLSFAHNASERLRATEGGARLILERPLVVMYKEGFSAPGASGERAATINVEKGFDIVCPGAVPGGGNAQQRAAAGIGYGTYLTDLELAAVQQLEARNTSRILNASANLEAARKRGQRLVALRKAGEDTGVGASEDVRARLRADLVAGFIVVTVQANSQQSRGQAAWWRLDPVSGIVIGVGADAEGQAMTENQVLLFKTAMMLVCEVAAKSSAKSGGQLVLGLLFCLVAGGVSISGTKDLLLHILTLILAVARLVVQ